MTEHEAEIMKKLAMSLDCCMELVDAHASRERRAGQGKSLRPVTWQDRAKSFPLLVDEAREALIAAGKHVFF